MKKILPTPKIPTKTLNNTASLSIVINNMPSAFDWECLNCVKLHIKEHHPLDFSQKLRISQKAEIPFIKKEWKIGKDYYEIIESASKIINFLEKEINEDKYVYFFFEQYNIPGMKPYHKYIYQHDGLLYGYDNTSRNFYILSYTSNNKFESICIDYDILVTAIIDNKSSRQYFISCSPTPIEFSLSTQDIYSYLSTCLGFNNNADLSMYINMGIYEALVEQIVMSWKFDIDFRSYKLLFEHMECIQYLSQRLTDLLPNINFSEEMNIANKCITVSDLLFKVLIKYCLTKRAEIKWRAIEILKELQKTEYILLVSLCDKLIDNFG